MTTVVNNPTPVQNSGDSGGAGFLVGIVIFVLFIGTLVYFAIPAIQNARGVQVNVPAPQINVETPQVVAPTPAQAPAPETTATK